MLPAMSPHSLYLLVTAFQFSPPLLLLQPLNLSDCAKKVLERKAYHKMLPMTEKACEDEIKKAYKLLARTHYPDRHAAARGPKFTRKQTQGNRRGLQSSL